MPVIKPKFKPSMATTTSHSEGFAVRYIREVIMSYLEDVEGSHLFDSANLRINMQFDQVMQESHFVLRYSDSRLTARARKAGCGLDGFHGDCAHNLAIRIKQIDVGFHPAGWHGILRDMNGNFVGFVNTVLARLSDADRILTDLEDSPKRPKRPKRPKIIELPALDEVKFGVEI